MPKVMQADVAAAKKYGYSVWRDMKTHELIEGQTILECLASHRESTEQAPVDKIVAWLLEDASKDAQTVRNLHREKKLTPAQTREWQILIDTKAGICRAIQRGDWK